MPNLEEFFADSMKNLEEKTDKSIGELDKLISDSTVPTRMLTLLHELTFINRFQQAMLTSLLVELDVMKTDIEALKTQK